MLLNLTIVVLYLFVEMKINRIICCKEFDNDELENESKPFYPVQKPIFDVGFLFIHNLDEVFHANIRNGH